MTTGYLSAGRRSNLQRIAAHEPPSNRHQKDVRHKDAGNLQAAVKSELTGTLQDEEFPKLAGV